MENRPHRQKFRRFQKRNPNGSADGDAPPLRPVFDQVVLFLARRDHSEKELQDKLKRYGYSPEQIAEGIAKAHSYKYMRDENELSERVAAGLNRKKKSHLYINQYLREKGLPSQEKALDIEIQKGRKIMEQKLGHAAPLTKEERDKVSRWLMQRGFDWETIRKVIYEKSGDS